MPNDIAYLDLLSELPAIRQRFLKWSNVRNVGLGAKEKSGEILPELAFRFYVERKLPLSEIPLENRIPAHINGVNTDVISFISSQSMVSVSSVAAVDENEYRDTGIRGGISIRNEHFDNDQPSGYGTLGILARRVSDDALVGITCAHIVNAASESIEAINTKIGQPKYWISCCCCPRGWIGNVKKVTLNNDLDCATIEIDEDIEEHVANNDTENKVQGIDGEIEGAALPLLLDTVRKYGRTTGLTTGRVVDIAYGQDQMLIELLGGNPGDAFAHHGDSGAVIVNEDNQVIGLLVAAAQETDTTTVPNRPLPLTKAIATLIKPVMEELDIKIAGVVAEDVTFPVRAKPWPGGQTNTSLNPVEVFSSTDFGLTGNVNWDVSGAGPGAVIIETGGQTANNLASISVRYNTVSTSKSNEHAISIKATKGTDEVEKFRTVFKITPRINVTTTVDPSNTKRFIAEGGIRDRAGVGIPGTDGASWFVAKAEIIFDVLPADIQWDSNSLINFITDASGGSKGDIVARRQTKFTKGLLAVGDPTPTRTIELNWISAGDSTANDFQGPTTLVSNTVFRLANEGLDDPNNLLQAYIRADFRDYLELHDGTSWIRITPFAEWFANLTADFNGPQSIAVPPPNVGAINTVGIGSTNEPIPNVIYCGFVGNETVVTKTGLVDKIVEIAQGEHDNWRNPANGNRFLQAAAQRFTDLVIYCLAVQLNHNSISPGLVAQIQNEVRRFPGLTRNSNFTTVSNTISSSLGGSNNDVVARRIRRALNLANDGSRDDFPWSAVFVTHCVRQAALDLEIEHEDASGAIQGREKILVFGNSHSQYSQPAFQRVNNGILGCYQAFEPDQEIEVGDIIIQDRRTCLIDPGPGNPCPPAQRLQINDVREFADLAITPPTTHGDIVVSIDNANNSVITIGGNTGDSVRRRRFPIDNRGVLEIDDANRRTWTQEPNNGNDPPNTGINNANPLFGSSTSRIFAVLKLIEECQQLPA